MANLGLRTIAFAYRDFEEQEFERMLETNQLTEQLEQSMTFTCLIALEDPLRERVQKVVKYAKKGNINVRLISGDHVETVKAVAQDAGILDSDVMQNLALEDEHKWVMEAKHFSDLVGEIEETEDDEGNRIQRLSNQEKFNELAETLKVIGRANPEHKKLFAVGL